MMIEHAALYTIDLERARAFYETYFDGAAGKLYHNPKPACKRILFRLRTGRGSN